MAASVPTLGQGRLKPSVYFRPIAQATSNNPATSNAIQTMPFLLADEPVTGSIQG
jgi:hypothetical protein